MAILIKICLLWRQALNFACYEYVNIVLKHREIKVIFNYENINITSVDGLEPTRVSTHIMSIHISLISLQWRHNDHDGGSNNQPQGCLLNRLFRCRSKKTSKLRVTGHYVGNSPVTGEFPAQRASNAEDVSIWWCHHVYWTMQHY